MGSRAVTTVDAQHNGHGYTWGPHCALKVHEAGKPPYHIIEGEHVKLTKRGIRYGRGVLDAVFVARDNRDRSRIVERFLVAVGEAGLRAADVRAIWSDHTLYGTVLGATARQLAIVRKLCAADPVSVQAPAAWAARECAPWGTAG